MAADDIRPRLEKVHPRPDQAEEPTDDIGASNVDLDESRHGPAHVSPAVPEPGHDVDAGDHDHDVVAHEVHGHDVHGHDVVAHDDHGHDDHDAHGDHPVESPVWVLIPVVLGLIVGAVLVIVLTTIGGGSDATPFHSL